MSFTLFLVLLFGVPCLLVLLAAWRFYAFGTKTRAFKLLIIFFTAIMLWMTTEGYYFIQSANTSSLNPWFFWAGEEIDSYLDEGLPYKHKPNIDWEGLSHGDLALANYDFDPYAYRVRYQTDNQGFRNRSEIAKADVIFLGDSNTEAGNVSEEETFVRLYEKETGYVVKNMGVSGYTTPHEEIILKNYGLATRPDVVVLQISESNDLVENVVYHKNVTAGVLPAINSTFKSDRNDSWKRASPTYHLFQRLFPFSLNSFPLEALHTDYQGNRWVTRFVQLPNEGMMPKQHMGWRVMAESLQRINEVCQQNKIRLVVLFIPDKITVLKDVVTFDPSVRKKLESQAIRKEETLGYYVGAFCYQNGIDFIDPTPTLLKTAEEGKVVYIPMDTHLSPIGHQVVAESLVARIKR